MLRIGTIELVGVNAACNATICVWEGANVVTLPKFNSSALTKQRTRQLVPVPADT